MRLVLLLQFFAIKWHTVLIPLFSLLLHKLMYEVLIMFRLVSVQIASNIESDINTILNAQRKPHRQSWRGYFLCLNLHSLCFYVCEIFDCLTDPCHFIPAFVELTSSNVDENRRLITEHGITFPLGIAEFSGLQCFCSLSFTVVNSCAVWIVNSICVLFNASFL